MRIREHGCRKGVHTAQGLVGCWVGIGMGSDVCAPFALNLGLTYGKLKLGPAIFR